MKRLFHTVGTLFSILFLLIFLWVSYLSVSFFSSERIGNIHYSVPKNSELIIELDAKNVFQTTFFELFIGGKGDEVAKKIKELSKKESAQKQYGINWIEPVSYFKTTVKGKAVQGLIVQVINSRKWNENINTLLGNTSVALLKNTSGIVVQSDELTKDELYAFIEQLKVETPIKKERLAENQLISVQQKNTDLSFSAKENYIHTNGTIDHNGNLKSNQLKFRLSNPSDFHLTTDIIPNEWNDSLNAFFGTDFEFAGISMNYRGVTIATINNETTPLPNMDAVLGFKNPTTVEQFAESIPKAIFQNDESIRIGKQIYFVKQLDEKTLFIGTNQRVDMVENQSSIGLLVLGSLKPLMKIEGNQLLRMLIRSHPVVSVGMIFSEEIEYCNIRLDEINASSHQLTASIQFKKEDDAVLKLLEMLIR